VLSQHDVAERLETRSRCRHRAPVVRWCRGATLPGNTIVHGLRARHLPRQRRLAAARDADLGRRAD